jgi:hypothetical protein
MAWSKRSYDINLGGLGVVHWLRQLMSMGNAPGRAAACTTSPWLPRQSGPTQLPPRRQSSALQHRHQLFCVCTSNQKWRTLRRSLMRCTSTTTLCCLPQRFMTTSRTSDTMCKRSLCSCIVLSYSCKPRLGTANRAAPAELVEYANCTIARACTSSPP